MLEQLTAFAGPVVTLTVLLLFSCTVIIAPFFLIWLTIELLRYKHLKVDYSDAIAERGRLINASFEYKQRAIRVRWRKYYQLKLVDNSGTPRVVLISAADMRRLKPAVGRTLSVKETGYHHGHWHVVTRP